MFRLYSVIEKEFTFPERVESKYAFYAYKQGSFKVFEKESQAKEYSKLVERVWVNEEEYKEYMKKWQEVNNSVYNTWYNEIRQEFSEFTQDQFELIFSEACDRGDGSGYDEIGMYVSDIAEFARKLIAMVK